jgi:CheY-like chemotaxis protein
MAEVKHNPKILIAEDDEITIKILEKLARELPAEVMIVKDGVECLNAIADFDPDLLLLDVAMPNMTGLEVLEAIRQDTIYDSLPIILLTGSRDLATISDAVKLGIRDYMVKPFDLTDLVQRIRGQVAYIYLSDLKTILPNLRLPEEKMINQIPAFENHTHDYDAYPVLYKNQKICVVLPTHLNPKMLLDLNKDQLFFEVLVFIKANKKWRQIWPHNQSLKETEEEAS